METISPVYARFVLREIIRQNIPEEQLLAGTRLTRPELESGGDIPMEAFLTILHNGHTLCESEQLGLLIGRHTNIIALGQIGAAAAIAPTVREGLQVIEHYTRLHISYVRVDLSSSLHRLSVRFRYLRDTGAAERFHTESSVMLLQNYIETLTGKELKDALYHLPFTAPSYQSEYANWLHSPISFDSEYGCVDIPSHWLDQPSPYFNAEMWQQATLMLARRLRELEGEQRRPYTQYIHSLMHSCEPPLPDLPSVASKLHMSERTLNRRLQREDTSYRAIKGKVLDSWARLHLTQTNHSVEAIAAALGYRDTANFRRAFRKSEGCSPSEFRRKLCS